MTNIPNIGKDTIARTVAAALALLNSALVMAGKAPLNLDESGRLDPGRGIDYRLGLVEG